MKFKVTMKDPDTLLDAIQDAFNKQTRFWSVRRGLVGECELPQAWDNKPFRKLDDAKRAINQFMRNNNYTVGR